MGERWQGWRKDTKKMERGGGVKTGKHRRKEGRGEEMIREEEK